MADHKALALRERHGPGDRSGVAARPCHPTAPHRLPVRTPDKASLLRPVGKGKAYLISIANAASRTPAAPTGLGFQAAAGRTESASTPTISPKRRSPASTRNSNARSRLPEQPPSSAARLTLRETDPHRLRQRPVRPGSGNQAKCSTDQVARSFRRPPLVNFRPDTKPASVL